jgi:hypothetical protein
MAYSELTSSINNLISESGNEWKNVPGGLEKVSESSMGAVWGLNNGILYSCFSPCKGQWNPENLVNVLDFTTDDSLVYALTDSLNTKNGNASGEWTTIPLKINIQKIFSSGSYIWGQSGTQKWKLAKPGTTGNWIPVQDDVTITSASQTSLYGINSTGKAVKTDESLQNKWSIIPQFKGVFSGILGDQDESAIYGVNSQQIQKCVGDECSTEINQVKNMSVNPNNLWLTTENQGNLGNVYVKSKKTDFPLDELKPIDDQRDSAVKQIEDQYNQKTYSTMMSDQLKIITNMFKDLTKNKVDDSTVIKGNTDTTAGEADILEKVLPLVFRIIILLIGLIIVYMCSGFLGTYTHSVALAFLVGGIYYFAVNT